MVLFIFYLDKCRKIETGKTYVPNYASRGPENLKSPGKKKKKLVKSNKSNFFGEIQLHFWQF